jgi:hypothetical protein
MFNTQIVNTIDVDTIDGWYLVDTIDGWYYTWVIL